MAPLLCALQCRLLQLLLQRIALRKVDYRASLAVPNKAPILDCDHAGTQPPLRVKIAVKPTDLGTVANRRPQPIVQLKDATIVQFDVLQIGPRGGLRSQTSPRITTCIYRGAELLHSQSDELTSLLCSLCRHCP